jgi:hypothetical protein
MKNFVNHRVIFSAAFLFVLAQGCGGGEFEAVLSEENLSAGDDSMVLESALSGELPVGTTLRTTANLNLRRGPGTSHGIILTIPNGSNVTVVASRPQNGFYNIRYGSATGWSSGNFLVRAGTTTTTQVSITGPAVLPHVQTFANRVCAAVGCPFTVGTRVGHSPTAERALDFMQAAIGRHPTDGGVRGDRLSSYALNNWAANRLMYIIWKQRINSNDGRGWRFMADRGSITQNHYDHVHVSFNP